MNTAVSAARSGVAQMPDRSQKILAGLDLSGKGLEVGAGHNPIVTRADGYDIDTLDHTDQQSLIAKFAAHGWDTSRVQPVDYVWSGQRYFDLVKGKPFDWILASHVIEHVPDLIGFINQCSEILNATGILSLAIPDRRFTFDYYRPASGIGPIIDAHVLRRTISSPGSAVENLRNACTMNGAICWDRSAVGVPNFMHPPQAATDAYAEIVNNNTYNDCHAWVFTPSSFRLVMLDLFELGFINLREHSFQGSLGHEFFCQLSKAGTGPGMDRVALANLALSELEWRSEEKLERAAGETQRLQSELESTRSALLQRNLALDELERQSEELAHAAPETERLRRELESVQRTLTGVLQSKSWRVTAPIRHWAENRRAKRTQS